MPAAADQAATQLSATLKQAFALHQQGALAQAQELYQQVLQVQPENFDALHLLGVAAYQAKDPAHAVELIGRAIAIDPGIADAHNNLGNAWQDLGQPEAALKCFDAAIALKPDFAAARYNRGRALRELNRHEAAVESFDRAIALNPAFAEAYYNRGNAFLDLQRMEEALDSYARTIELKADHVKAHLNRGVALEALGQLQAALESYSRVIELEPAHADAHYARGNALLGLQQHEAALASYARAIMLKPGLAEAHCRRGDAFLQLRNHEAALQCYSEALALKPDYDFLYGTCLYARMLVCDWSNAEQELAKLTAKIEGNDKAAPPFSVLPVIGDPRLQEMVAARWRESMYPPGPSLPEIRRRYGHDRIRLGYYSADFHDHATAYLMAHLFEHHDRSRFELIGFSFGADRNDEMRVRVQAAFDRFIDVRNRSDRDIALLSRSLEVDIAVDLKGYTERARPGIFAMNAAPLQVSYLGYPGTMAAEFIDYLIADPTLIPEESRQHYHEKIAYLPNSYQVNDARRRIADRRYSREELGLPETGFVFCCFNNNYKIVPSTFDGWMRILKQVDGSVLWLLEDNPAAAGNLVAEAGRRGVDGKRLIFAGRMPLPDHLARHRAADLFIDTLPYNAHTTASDALWAGLPLLTCAGHAFAGRVAASLLNAVGLPELVTSTQAEYEERAVQLATDPSRLQGIRKKLADNRLSTALFDTQLFARHIESAYLQMYERYQADLPPGDIYVRP